MQTLKEIDDAFLQNARNLLLKIDSMMTDLDYLKMTGREDEELEAAYNTQLRDYETHVKPHVDMILKERQQLATTES